MQLAQPCAVLHGQRHCGRAHGVEVQVQDAADGLLGVVVLLAEQRADRGPHVLVGLLVGDKVNGSLAGQAA